MEVKVEDVSPVEKKIGVEIPWEEVVPKLESALRDVTKDVAIKGFRKGKVPRHMVEKMYGPAIEQEVIKQLVQESFVSLITDHNVEAVSEPRIEEARFERGKPFFFAARIEVRSHVEPKDYLGIELGERAAAVSEEQIDRALEHKQQELTEYKVIEPGSRPEMITGANDVVVVELKGTVGDKPIDRNGILIDLSDTREEQIPGLAQALLGMSLTAVNQIVDFTVPAKLIASASDTPTDDHPLAGQKVSLQVTVKEAREKRVPKLDDDFAKDTGDADTLADLRIKVRERLLEADKKQARQDLKLELVKELLKRNLFAVAPSLVEQQLGNIIERAKMGMALRGIDLRQTQIDENRLRDELREQAQDEVRTAFLLDAIAKAEKVEVTQEQIDERIREIAEARGQNATRYRTELQKEGRIESLKLQLQEEKTLDLLLERAKISVQAEKASATTNQP